MKATSAIESQPLDVSIDKYAITSLPYSTLENIWGKA